MSVPYAWSVGLPHSTLWVLACGRRTQAPVKFGHDPKGVEAGRHATGSRRVAMACVCLDGDGAGSMFKNCASIQTKATLPKTCTKLRRASPMMRSNNSPTSMRTCKITPGLRRADHAVSMP